MINYNKSKDDYVLKVSNRDFITQILSEETLSKEFIDWEKVQTLEEFANHSNPINYISNDFLIQVSLEILNQLKNNISVEFSNVNCFGWYLNKNHRVETRLFENSYPNKIKSLQEKNPSLQLRSFDQFRISYRPQKVRNILNGAFGLSYHFFKDDYDSFFKKINWEKDTWFINSEDISSFDRQILLQLLLYQNNRNSDLVNLIVNGSDALRLYYDILNHSMEYFVYKNYSMDGFIEYLANNLDNEDVIKDLKELKDRYVVKGLPYKPLIKHTKIIQEFLDLAKTEQSALINSLDNKSNKSAIYLLGMLFLGDRLDPQFEFDNFIPSIVTLTMEHIVDMYIEDKLIIIGFDENEIIKDRNKKFSYVKEYFNELKHIERFNKNLSILKSAKNKSEDEYQQTLLDQIKEHDPKKKGKSEFNKLMHETVHKWFHPDPKRAKYQRRKKPPKNKPKNSNIFLKLFNKMK